MKGLWTYAICAAVNVPFVVANGLMHHWLVMFAGFASIALCTGLGFLARHQNRKHAEFMAKYAAFFANRKARWLP